jgi:hypothetical protein
VSVARRVSSSAWCVALKYADDDHFSIAFEASAKLAGEQR